MTSSARLVAYDEVHEATLSFLQAGDAVALWQLLLGRAIGTLDGYGGSFWVPEAGGMRRIMVGGVDELARASDRLEGDELTRLSEGDASSLVVAREIRTPDKRIAGVLRVCRPLDDGEPDEAALDTLRALCAVVGSVAGAMQREQALQAKARDFTLVAELSREVTATLDLDRVLRVVVNLAAKAVTFDRGALALYEDGACDIRAVAGAEKVDSQDPKLRDLAERAAWAAGRGDGLYVSDREDPASDAERVFLQFFAADLEADDVRSGLYLPLRDEEGIVGVLVLESTQAEFATEHQRDVAGILANQATVAIRNARLYSQVPLVDMLGAIGERRKAIRAIPKRTKRLVATSVIVALALLTLIRWPLRVDGHDALLLPAERAVVRSMVDGQIEQVLVRSGDKVAQGAPVLKLRALDRSAARTAARADADAAEREAALAAARGDAVEERLARLRAATAREQVSLLDADVRATIIRAPVAGVVLTERLEELQEARATAGSPLLTIGRLDSLEVTFTVPQRDVARLTSEQRVRLRTEAVPQATFEGRVIAIAPLPTLMTDTVSSATAVFPVRAMVANTGEQLRPGMTPYVRVLTSPASVAERLLRRPWRAFRLFYWKLTA